MRAASLWMTGLIVGCGASSGAPAGPGSEVVEVDPPAGPGAMAPNLTEAPGGEALLTWLEPVGAASHRLRFSRFSRGAWSAPVTVAEGPGLVASWADLPSAAEAAGGVVVAHWAERPAGASGARGAAAYDVALARSTDRGATWRRVGTANDDGSATEHGFVSLLPEGERVRAFWLDGRATGSAAGAMTLRTALVGERVEAGELLDARVCDCCSTAAVRTERGPLLAYRDRSDEEVRDIAVLTRDERAPGSAWSTPRPVYRDGWRIAGCPVNGPAVAARGRAAAVAWYTSAGGRPGVRAAFSRDGGVNFAPAIEIAGATGGRAPLGHVGAVLEPSGEALVSWTASGRGGAELLVRRVAPDGRLGRERALTRIPRPARGASVPRMIGLGDDLMVAWVEPGARSHLRARRVARRAIAACGELGGRALPSTDGGAAAHERRADGPIAGEVAPPYAAVSLAGDRVSLAGLRGKVVLLDVWATWCVPCRAELFDLARLHRKRAGDGLAIVAVSVDGRDARQQVADFARARLPFAVWLDPDDVVSERFGVRSLPTTVLIGRDGVIRWRRDGVVSAGDPELGRALDAALAEPAPRRR